MLDVSFLVSYFASICLTCILAAVAIVPIAKHITSPEIDYVKVLNRILPRDIRVLGWCPVSADFHARLAQILCLLLASVENKNHTVNIF
jgi:hypothetical protein